MRIGRRVWRPRLVAPRPVIALFPWGLLLEDFLRPNGLTLADFCGEFTGSWMFGYADALRCAGVDTVIFSVTSEVDVVTRVQHSATGTAISLLPAPRAYRRLRSHMQEPYGRATTDVFPSAGRKRAMKPALFAAKEAAPYLATPLKPFLQELRYRSCTGILCQEYEFPRFDFCVATRVLHRLPVFASFQGGDYRRWRVERIVRPRAVSAAAGLIVPSQAERERIAKIYRLPRVASIPNPIDLSIWHPRDRLEARRALEISEETLVVAWHGRVQIWKKGLDTLLDAWAALSAEGGLDLRLLLVGTGADAEDVRGRILMHDLANVTFIDRYIHDREEIARILAAADIYAFPSRHEGFPLAPLEAMACGLPVVATDVSGIRDVLHDGARSGGALVPVDDPAALARELRRFLVDGEMRRQSGIAAESTAEPYGMEAIGSALRAFMVGDRLGRSS